MKRMARRNGNIRRTRAELLLARASLAGALKMASSLPHTVGSAAFLWMAGPQGPGIRPRDNASEFPGNRARWAEFSFPGFPDPYP